MGSKAAAKKRKNALKIEKLRALRVKKGNSEKKAVVRGVVGVVHPHPVIPWIGPTGGPHGEPGRVIRGCPEVCADTHLPVASHGHDLLRARVVVLGEVEIVCLETLEQLLTVGIDYIPSCDDVGVVLL